MVNADPSSVAVLACLGAGEGGLGCLLGAIRVA